MSETITTTIIGEDGTPLEVEGEYHPPEKGSKDRFGQQIEPDVDGWVYVWDYGTNSLGDTVLLTNMELDIAEEALLEVAQEARE